MNSRQKREREHMQIWLYGDYGVAKLWMLKEVGRIVLILSSLVAWGYVLTVHDGTAHAVLLLLLAANGIVLAGNLVFYVGLYGYRDGFGMHVTVTYLVSVFLSVIAFYVSGIDIPAEPAAVSVNGFARIVQFFVYLLISVVMSVVPSVMDCGLMWLIVHIFGEKIPDSGQSGKKYENRNNEEAGK